MIKRVFKYLEIMIIIFAIAFFIIQAFSSPRFAHFEDEDYTVLFRNAESLNYLFRTSIFLVTSTILIWRLVKPNKVLRIISLTIVLVTVIIVVLDTKGLIDYYQVFSIRKF